MNRRDLLRQAVFTGAALAATPLGTVLSQTAPPSAPEDIGGPFTLPPLPYAASALEPYIDAVTMTVHHDKHHATYVKNLNKAVAGQPNLASQSVESLIKNLNTLPDTVRNTIRNNAGGHLNHSFFWTSLMGKGAPAEATGALNKAITGSFGSITGFQEKFTAASLGIFGSGWAWLSVTPKKELVIETTPNQDSPWMSGGNTPILGLDVWEHAYYLKYQNKRADYIAAFFHVIHWETIGSRYEQALKG